MTELRYVFDSESEADTGRLAERIGKLLQPGAVIALDGDLGAGKTRFSQSVAKAIGVADVVNSPTFTIIKEYQGAQFPLYHMDVYRLSREEEEELGLDEYFFGDGVTLVEWASRIGDLLPERHLSVRIRDLGGQRREFELTPYGQPYTDWCKILKENGTIR